MKNTNQASLYDVALLKQAAWESFKRLSPLAQVKNPVMFVVWLGSVLTTVLCVQAFMGQGGNNPWFVLAIALWHIAKCGLVRAAAVRRIAELLPAQPAPEPLGAFLTRAVVNAPVRVQYQPPSGTPQPRRRAK